MLYHFKSRWLPAIIGTVCFLLYSHCHSGVVHSAGVSTKDDSLALARKYFLGNDVERDGAKALRLYKLAADKGHPEGLNGVGVCYATGTGVGKDEEEAVVWFKKAAQAKSVKGQLNLAASLWDGSGIGQDRAKALAWAWVASSLDEHAAAETAIGYAARMKSSDILRARRAAKAWLAREMPRAKIADLEFVPKKRPSATGTGFFVTEDGLFLTATHVIHRKSSIWILANERLLPAEVVSQDNDIALLKTYGEFQFLSVREAGSMRLGETVFTMGFPNIRLQGVRPKLTKGEISSLSGAKDSAKTFQISVPVQAGNSGGPLVDVNGNAVGVISARLDEEYTLRHGNGLPQNVNYAAKLTFDSEVMSNVAKIRKTDRIPNDLQGEVTEGAVKGVQQSLILVLVFDGR